MKVKVILLDVMDTLVEEPFRSLLNRLLLSRERREQFFHWKDRQALHEFERGEIAEQEYIRRFYLADTPKEILRQLPRPSRIKKELFSNLRYLPGMKPLLVGLQSDPYIHIGIASNYSEWYQIILKALPEIGDCNYLFFSCEMGIRKPEIGYYRVILSALRKKLPRLAGKDILFVDDRAANLEPAEKLGWRVHLMQGNDGLMTALSRFSGKNAFPAAR